MKVISRIPENMTVEKLWAQVESLRRDVQSSKDKAVKQTNERLENMEEAIAELQRMMREILDG